MLSTVKLPHDSHSLIFSEISFNTLVNGSKMISFFSIILITARLADLGPSPGNFDKIAIKVSNSSFTL